jgi:hypothetical protein
MNNVKSTQYLVLFNWTYAVKLIESAIFHQKPYFIVFLNLTPMRAIYQYSLLLTF